MIERLRQGPHDRKAQFLPKGDGRDMEMKNVKLKMENAKKPCHAQTSLTIRGREKTSSEGHVGLRGHPGFQGFFSLGFSVGAEGRTL